MHDIEPYSAWKKHYRSEKDYHSPFFGREYSAYICSNAIYGYYIHPQWDEFGSDTLYIKILYADYERNVAIIELFGEWNDTLYNDVMFLKRNVLEVLMESGINKFLLIGDNVLNFHASDDLYYEEWFDEVEDGWIVGLNFRDHILDEMNNYRIDYYILTGDMFNNFEWRTYHPKRLLEIVEAKIFKKLAP